LIARTCDADARFAQALAQLGLPTLPPASAPMPAPIKALRWRCLLPAVIKPMAAPPAAPTPVPMATLLTCFSSV